LYVNIRQLTAYGTNNREGVTLLCDPNLSAMPPYVSYKDQIMKFKQICIKSIAFMIHKNLSSTHYLTVNISGLDGESLTGGVLGCTTYSEETSTVEASVDGTDGNGGGGGWHMGASTVDGCDGRGGVDGWTVGASTEDAWNKKDVGGGW
jgi:hypothetical protein